MNVPTPGSRPRAEGCLEDETLGAFLEGRLEASRLARVAEHATACAPCRELLALGARVAGASVGRPPRVGASVLLEVGAGGPNGRVGATLKDKWRLEAKIGAGGMADVYAGVHRNGKRVAIKILSPQLAVDPALCRRFVQEGYIANQIAHPGVVSVHDDDTTEDGAPFLVMDLLEGECLSEIVERGPMPVDEAVRISIALLDILAAAHDKGVLHRDVKPGNVFLTTDGGVRLLDFGIARAERNAQTSATLTGATMGTPAFMPPEQARGRMRDVDARSDIWAAGATLFTMLTAAKVRDGETNNELLVKAVTQPIRPVLEHAPWLFHALAAIVDRSLAFEKADRFPSARAMQEALASLPSAVLNRSAAGATLPLTPTTSVPSPVAAVTSKSRVAGVVGGAVLVLAAAAMCVVALGRIAPAPSARATSASAAAFDDTSNAAVAASETNARVVATSASADPASPVTVSSGRETSVAAPLRKAKSDRASPSVPSAVPARRDPEPDPYERRL